jgi:CHAD domain-containing protein
MLKFPHVDGKLFYHLGTETFFSDRNSSPNVKIRRAPFNSSDRALQWHPQSMGKRRSESSEDFPLLTYLDQLVESLRALVPKAIRDQESDAIHDARVATRRLKASLDLMRPVLSKRYREPFARTLRDLRRTLGEMRDLNVMIDHLGEFHATETIRPAIEWLIARLNDRCDDARRSAAKDASPTRVIAKLGAWWGVRAEIEEAREATDSLLAESLHLQLDAFCEQADALAGIRAPASAPPHDPHALRIAGKSLRYTLEMAAVEDHPLPAGVLRKFKRLQESLGLWHDFVVLTERAMCEAVDAMLPHHNANLQRQVFVLSQATLKLSERYLSKVVRLWKSNGEGLAREIRETFPLTRALSPNDVASAGNVIGSQMDPGLPG